MKTTYQANSEADLPRIAKEVIEQIDQPTVVLFYGEMGAGKTTFIRSLCKTLGIEETVTSPTFSLVNEYLSSGDETVYHFDFYRIENPEEALDIGVEEYFYSGNFCFVEWPEKIQDYLPKDALKITIIEENEVRKIEVEV